MFANTIGVHISSIRWSDSVFIINSYKFPHCWVRVVAETKFENDIRLAVFDAHRPNRDGLSNVNNVSYGNIQEKYISAYVSDWIKVFNNINL